MNTALDLVRSRLGSFTRVERLITLELMRSYPSAGFEIVAEFARRAGTSGPTVLRFVGKLDFRS